jgi:broad specificity phosphatase PhoE
MMTIYLVRHCEAEGNTRGVLQGRSDCDVSGNSEKQLELVSLRLRNVPFAAVYSSPLRRAWKTAQSIDRYHGLGVEKDARLTEIDMGTWEGRSWADIAAEGPAMLRVWNEDPGAFEAPGGESVRHVADRMWEAMLDIAGKNEGKTVCVVSHGCAIRSFLCRALGWPLEKMNDIPWSDNTGVSVVEFENGKAHVARMNDSSHIPPELSVYRRPSAAGEENMMKDVAP